MASDLVKLTTPVFRLSFPALYEPKSMEGTDQKPKYGCSAVWTPSKFSDREKKLWAAILAELDRVSKEKFKKAWKDLPDTVRRGIRDGASKDNLKGYGEGTRFASLTTKNRPGIVDKDGFTHIGPEHGNGDLIYPGCYCRATINVFAYDNKGKGLGLGLRNLQKIADGERLDNRVAPEDDFDEEIESKWLETSDDDEIPF